MEVAIGGNGSTPFQREVREWQRVDPETGALLTGRLEADRWINGPLNAYGKVVDSQNVSQPNGTQHTQRKQLEVLQARTSSGSLQVVRAQTVQTSSSRWSSGTRKTQALDGQRLSSGLSLNGHHHKESHHFTNGHHSHLSSSKQNFHSQLSHFNSQNIGGPHLLATQPSLKLSTLMKSSNAALDGGGRISPHSTMPLLQRHHSQLVQQQHQQLESETQSSPFNCSRFQPTIVEPRVGGGGYVSNCESRHPKTQQMDGERETSDTINGSPRLSRGRSVSTDDLATDWDPDTVDDTEPSEWRRVSKIRRSFQLPKNSPPPKPSSTRPVDLPENSVSVSKIRQELENGRRLNTAMRNNYVDLAALDNILNGNGSPEPEHKTDGKTVKKASFLTAESLKEIRGKLKKLSDESLYKEDFITQNDIDKSNDVENDNSSNFIVQQPVILQDSHVVHQQTPSYTPPSRTTFQLRLKQDPQHTTNSLESRTKYRDTTSAEWHLRRKSYGFEKMTPPAESMFRMESSTDSGIGRSSELNSWSPTENVPRGTVITFGERKSPPRTIVTLMNNGEESSTSLKPVVNRRYHDPISETVEVKRHSIAVDESKYVRDNLKRVFDAKTSVHINGLYLKENNSSQASVTDESGRRQKRVEFCKTEVHFAAESGRVNIVETDGKPPPTNNFRRRRRTSGGSVTSAYLEAINSGVPVIHFGDEQKTAFEQESVVEETKALKSNVTVSIPVTNGGGPDALISKPVLEEDEEAQFSDEISLRGILKNKPVKPKPYHLGENIDNSESLWGVRLKPVTGEDFAVKRRSYDGEREDAVSLEIEETKDISASAIKSVAERVRIVEERKAGSGYSTKINLNLTNSPYSWETTDTEINKPLKLCRENENIEVKSARRVSQVEIVDQGLKSTSLIMRTMRSASHFDEAMRRLSITDPETSLMNTSSRLVSNVNAITKSSSANSIFLDPNQIIRPKYASSLDGDFILNDQDSPNSRIGSSFNYNTTTATSNLSYERLTNGISGEHQLKSHMESVKEEPQSIEEMGPKKPIAAPRIKVIGSSNAVNHQLSQLRRMYDAADPEESDDSARADEEVNLYLGDGGDQTRETGEKVAVLSGSWSRVKAKRYSNKNNSTEEAKDLPKANVMSIELHSPTASVRKSQPAIITEVPVAKPRTISPVKTKRSIESETTTTAASAYQTELSRKSHSKTEQTKQKQPLKVVTGGTRKLRDHELSYFGVKVSGTNEEKPSLHERTKVSRNNNNPSRKASSTESANKWKLSSDKPDLLRHSPQPSSNGYIDMKKGETYDGPIYENLKKPSSYTRKKDLQRDEMILSEMTKTADQTMKAMTEEHAVKDQQRRTPQRSTKPLDTIDEKRSSQSRSMKSKAVQVSRAPAESFQRPCRSNRPSSASSNESLSRFPQNPTPIRSSRSRETKSNTTSEYVNVNSVKKRSTPIRECTKVHRSSSRETQKSHASSSEDVSATYKVEEVRRVKRVKPKEKDSSFKSHSTKPDERHRSTRASVENEDKNRSAKRSSGDPSAKSSRRSSSKTENQRKNSSSRTKATISSSDPHRTHSKSAGIVTTTSSSSKRSRDHARK